MLEQVLKDHVEILMETQLMQEFHTLLVKILKLVGNSIIKEVMS